MDDEPTESPLANVANTIVYKRISNSDIIQILFRFFDRTEQLKLQLVCKKWQVFAGRALFTVPVYRPPHVRLLNGVGVHVAKWPMPFQEYFIKFGLPVLQGFFNDHKAVKYEEKTESKF